MRVKFTGFVDVAVKSPVAYLKALRQVVDETAFDEDLVRELSLTWEETKITKEQVNGN